MFLKRRLHKEKLRTVLHHINPDVVISTGGSEKFFLPDIKGKWKLIREMHMASNYRILYAKTKKERFMASLLNKWEYNLIISKYDKLVLLTNEDKFFNWGNNQKIKVIPNPITIEKKYKSNLNNHIIISCGRLSAEKNFSSLIRIFHKIADKVPDWQLYIYGCGVLEKQLQDEIDYYKLSDRILLMGFTYDVFHVMENASIFALTSDYEGFGLVLVEAMTCNLPVISFDCPHGPKNIINNNIDGFLIGEKDEEEYAKKLLYLIKNKDMRILMGNNAKNSANKFSMDKIMNKWIALFNELQKKID